ncbi:MAG: transporter substrate-binding domain-containing protein [Bacteroidales bacterium]|nr:transporter substrate-binding domain-containing protein [Bacteroidales bacterium]MBN2634345.1 transporter substrate-binding domain-containing protein [Bacteroidales bacterium]
MIRKTIVFFVLLTAHFISCSESRNENTNTTVSFDLEAVISRGKLTAVTDFNSTSYFLYKGEPMGFHLELLQNFTGYLGVDLEIITENHPDRAIDMLNSGKADLLAMGLTVNSSRKKAIRFTEPIMETRQVLVQRKPRNWKSMTESNLDRHLIRNQLEIAHKTIYVQENSAHAVRLKSLASEIGDTINIIEVPLEPEELIRSVAKGEIEYTVSDENVARVNATYYPDIDVNTPVSFMQKIAWGVRKNDSDRLLEALDSWIAGYRKTKDFALLYAKYFRNSRSGLIVKSDYYSLGTGKISKWDDQLKKASDEINWDWRLLASLVCQESRFDPSVESWAGAYGLMQIMPETADRFGVDIKVSPENNIKAGIMYINWLHTIFDPKIEDEQERIKFILASYNAGPGHVIDAMKLAEKNGMDPHKWNGNVEKWLLKKSDPLYYNDTVVKSGYFKGTESVNFVRAILERYEHYSNMIPVTVPSLAQSLGS